MAKNPQEALIDDLMKFWMSAPFAEKFTDVEVDRMMRSMFDEVLSNSAARTLITLAMMRSPEDAMQTIVQAVSMHPSFVASCVGIALVNERERIEKLETEVATLRAKYEPIDFRDL